MVPSYEEHPLQRMVEAGVAVTLNADDPYWFGSTIAQEYELARTVFSLADRELAGIARTSTIRTGMTETTRRAMLEEIATWLGEEPPEDS
jgi:adenosine deaminase